MKHRRKRVGRPSKIRRVKIDQLERLCKAGWTDKEIAAFFKVSITTYKDYKKKFSATVKIKDWKDEADKKVEQSLYRRATGFVKVSENEVPPDPTSMIFWLKNRKPEQWRDKIEHSIERETIEHIIKQRKEFGFDNQG